MWRLAYVRPFAPPGAVRLACDAARPGRSRRGVRPTPGPARSVRVTNPRAVLAAKLVLALLSACLTAGALEGGFRLYHRLAYDAPLAAGPADLARAAEVAEQVGRRTDNVFVVRALDLAQGGGRLAAGAEEGESIPVLRLVEGSVRPVGGVRSVEEAADVMASAVLAAGDRLRVGISVADAGGAPLWEALEERLRDAENVAELVRYRVGPSVGAHTGPGTAGAMWYPTIRPPVTPH